MLRRLAFSTARNLRPKRNGDGDHCDHQYEQPYGNHDECVAQAPWGVWTRLDHAGSTMTDQVNLTVSQRRLVSGGAPSTRRETARCTRRPQVAGLICF